MFWNLPRLYPSNIRRPGGGGLMRAQVEFEDQLEQVEGFNLSFAHQEQLRTRSGIRLTKYDACTWSVLPLVGITRSPDEKMRLITIVTVAQAVNKEQMEKFEDLGTVWQLSSLFLPKDSRWKTVTGFEWWSQPQGSHLGSSCTSISWLQSIDMHAHSCRPVLDASSYE
jgi:hypothetical protein